MIFNVFTKAKSVSFNNANSGSTAKTVQEALDELYGLVSNAASVAEESTEESTEE